MARILDFTDGFTSSSEPVSTPFPIAVTPTTDNGIARYDGVDGNLQNSNVLINDSDDVTFPANIITPKQDVATTATIAQLDSTKTFYRFTGITGTEVQGILAGADGQHITIHNSSTALITFKHQDAGAAAADRFNFTDDLDIELDPDSSIEFIYDSTQARWVIKSGAGTSKLVLPTVIPTGLVNGSNTAFTIPSEPVSEDSVTVFIDGVALLPSEWSIVGATITLTTAPAIAQTIAVQYLTKGTPTVVAVPTGTFNVEYRTLSGGEITAKELTLVATPGTALKVVVDLISGCAQIYGTDFSVSGNILTWNGLGLDGVLITGDVLRVQYFS